MRSNKLRLALSVAATLLIFTQFPASASVGKAIYTFGNVTVETPAITTLERGGVVDEGDVIVTGPKGYAQIKLDDGTKIAIRPDSRFVIDALEAPATATTPAIGAGTTLRAKFSLQKGGFRTITGRISKRDPSAYQLTTPTAVISVRGTNYVARICAANCGAGTADGLYVGVSKGGIGLTNNGGSVNLSTNQYGYSAGINTPPTKLTGPPPSLQDDGLSLLGAGGDDADSEGSESKEGSGSDDNQPGDADGSGEKKGSGEGDGSGDKPGGGGAAGGGENDSLATNRGGKVGTGAAGTSRSTTPTGAPKPIAEKPPVREITGSGSGGSSTDLTGGEPTGGQVTIVPRPLGYSLSTITSGFNTNDDTISFDTDNNLTGFDGLNSDGQTELVSIGTAVNKNVGFDTNSQLRWGRWGGGIATQGTGATTDTGTSTNTNIDLNGQSLHWVVGNQNETVPTRQITGSASYTLVGNTDPTDNLGNVGVLGSATFSADFTNSTVVSNVALGINNQNWQASGSGTLTSNLFQGLYNTVSVNGVTGGSGSFGGLFGGYGTTGAPAGAGLGYQLTNGSTTVNGVAIFNTSTTTTAAQ